MQIYKNKQNQIVAFLFIVFCLAGCSGITRHNESILPCLEGENPVNIDRNYKFSGDLIFRNNEKGDIVAFNGKTHELTPLFRVKDGEFWLASPLSWDSKSLVVYPYPANVSNDGFLSMSIISFQGIAKQVKMPFSVPDSKKAYSWAASEWSNEESLQAVFFEQGNTGDEISEVVLLNPFKQRVQIFEDFVQKANRGEGEDGFLLSPDLSRAFFINNQYYLTLYDVTRQKELWTYAKADGAMMVLGSSDLRETVWSQTSDLLVIPAPSTQDTGNGTVILFVNRDGSILNSINFENYQHGFSWNSTENLLAFYGYECDLVGCTTEYKSVIRVLNVDENVVTDVCSLGVDTEPTNSNQNGRIVWSPDDSALAFASFSIRSAPGTFLVKKLNDPNLLIVPIDPYKYTLLGWSEYHWKSIE